MLVVNDLLRCLAAEHVLPHVWAGGRRRRQHVRGALRRGGARQWGFCRAPIGFLGCGSLARGDSAGSGWGKTACALTPPSPGSWPPPAL